MNSAEAATVDGMSPADDSFIADPVAAVEKDYTARLVRTFIVFAAIEGGLLAIVVVLVLVFKIVDRESGRIVLFSIVLLGGFALSIILNRHMRARTRAVAQARAENPLF